MKNTGQQWFKEAKFGLFIHWGLYSVLAGEYKGVKTTRIAEWIMNDLDIPVEEYEKLAEVFCPTEFSAEKIVTLAKSVGMKYIVLTAKHHEGFAMYHSKVSPYNIVDATPYKKDILADLHRECKKQGIRLGLYYSQAQDWHDKDGFIFRKNNEGKDFQAYMERKCLPQIREILEQYEDIALIWFDTPMGITKEQSEEIVKTVKSIQPNCIVSGRIGNDLGEYMTTGDNFIPKLPYHGDWELPATLNDTWGYNKDDHNWKSAHDLIRILLKVTSRGGNYLLNIGPMASGAVPEESVRILQEVGTYVNRNEEAIFGSQPVEAYPYELEWAEMTTKKYRLYLHILQPKIRTELIHVANTFLSARILGEEEELSFTSGLTCEGVHYIEIEIPKEYQDKSHYCIRIDMEEESPIFEDLL